MGISSLLQGEPVPTPPTSFKDEQRKDPKVMKVIKFLELGILPEQKTHLDRQGSTGTLSRSSG